VVQRKVVVLGSILRGVCPDCPAEVHIAGVLVVAEEKRVASVGVAQRREGSATGESEDRLADIIGADTIGAGDAESAKAEIAIGDVNGRLRSGALASVAKVGVDDEMLGNDVAGAQADVLNASRCRAGLATIKGAAASRAELLRVGDGERINTVTAEECRTVGGNVGDLAVGTVAVVGQGARRLDRTRFR